MKLTKTLFNKVRKHFYTFWVNLEHTIKHKKLNKQKDEIREGSEKIINFINAFETK